MPVVSLRTALDAFSTSAVSATLTSTVIRSPTREARCSLNSVNAPGRHRPAFIGWGASGGGMGIDTGFQPGAATGLVIGERGGGLPISPRRWKRAQPLSSGRDDRIASRSNRAFID